MAAAVAATCGAPWACSPPSRRFTNQLDINEHLLPFGTSSSNNIAAAREALGADADTVWAEGRAMAFDDAVGLALDPSMT